MSLRLNTLHTATSGRLAAAMTAAAAALVVTLSGIPPLPAAHAAEEPATDVSQPAAEAEEPAPDADPSPVSDEPGGEDAATTEETASAPTEVGEHGAHMGQGLARIEENGDPTEPTSAEERAAEGDGTEDSYGAAGNTWQPPGIQGIDVSSHQGDVDWGKAWNQGARFAYVKATEGRYYKNSYYDQQYFGARDAGMVTGAYHFANPATSGGRGQADYFINNGGGWRGDGTVLPPLLDIEYNPYGQVCYDKTKSQMITWIRNFSDRVKERVGRVPAIYTTTDWWETCTGNTDKFSDHPLHIANYSRSAAPLPNGWSAASIWQYSSTGPFVGDSNVWNGTRTSLTKFAKGSTGLLYTSYFTLENTATVYGVRKDGSFTALSRDQYAALGEPEHSSRGAIVKNSWSSALYLVAPDGTGSKLSYTDWQAYGAPSAISHQLLPGTYFFSKFGDSNLYYASPAGEVAATQIQWEAAGSPAITHPTRYVRYAWDSAVYRETATSLTESTVAVLDYDAWVAAGKPASKAMAYIPGSRIFKFSNFPTIFLSSPNGTVHALTAVEWKAIPEKDRSYTPAGEARFVKNSWSGAVYMVDANNEGPKLSYEQWQGYGKPRATAYPMIEGTYFFSRFQDGDYHYASPAGAIRSSQAEWEKAGQPAMVHPSRYARYAWDSAIYSEKATSVADGTATALSYEEWVAAGKPRPEVATYISGSGIAKFSDQGTIFLSSPAGAVHTLTLNEWRSIPAVYRNYTDAGSARFVTNSWSGAIYMVGDNHKGPKLSYEQWVAYGKPKASAYSMIEETYFFQKSGSSTIYYASPAGDVRSSKSEWEKAGSPEIRTR
jgi:GH25 family lysozyme M1 (1,4-beta-N-acetylmuramidase)